MSLVRQRRGDANKLGFSVQLALLRHPGIRLAEDTQVPLEVVSWLASRPSVSSEAWDEYGTHGKRGRSTEERSARIWACQRSELQASASLNGPALRP